MKKLAKLLAMVGIIIMICQNQIFALSTNCLNAIQVNGVYLAGIPNTNVNGKLNLVGSTNQTKVKVMISKDSKQTWYDMTLNQGKFDQNIWLSNGNGKYDVAIMVHEKGRLYSYGPKFTVNNVQDTSRFTSPAKYIESDNQDIIKLAKIIVGSTTKDKSRSIKLYNWVTSNIKYDYGKYRKHLLGDYSNDYGAIYTLKTRKGVCYDYATLYAALGRSLGMQVKVVKGDYKTNTGIQFHAWNEVYISEEHRWINLDTTFGSVLNKDFFDKSGFDSDHIKTEES